MIELDLRLELDGLPQREAVAWLISGDNPARWLEEIIAWKVDERKLALFILPESSAGGISAGGLFVVIADTAARPARQPHGLAFGAVAEGFYVPVNARLLPAMTTAELKKMMQQEVLVFHPAIGLTAFESGEALGVWDLLSAPREVATSWALPPVDMLPARQIKSVAFRSELSLENLFGTEANDIGQETPDSLPPGKEEKEPGVFSRGFQKLRGWLGGAGSEPRQASAFERMEQWVTEHVQGASRELALARNRSLLRLLSQLEKDPDEGLKRALPLGGSGLHRGLTPPTTELGDRIADFSLDRLKGGRASDFWHVPPDLLHQLRLQYLHLAERERQLGRYRRAAYIYAELLGDVLTAARVLAEGEFWREAAVLYRDHLHQPMEAASCFVKARLISEAVSIYEAAKAYESLAGLYLRMGETDRANDAFRRWIQKLISERRLLDAADILEQRLGAREEAMALLESAWPDGPDASRCIERCITMRAAAGEHEETARLLRRIAGVLVPTRRVLPLVRVLCGIQTAYPDRATRRIAEEYGRNHVARCISLGLDEETHRATLRLLPGLAPDDHLLAKDVHRFLDNHKPRILPLSSHYQEPKVIAVGGKHSATLELLTEYCLPESRVQWLKAAPVSGGLCAAGVNGDDLVVIRSTFEGVTQSVTWENIGLSDHSVPEILLSPSTRPDEYIFLAAVHGNPLTEHELPGSDHFPGARAGSPGWLADPVSAAAFAADRTLWVLRPTPTGAVISGFQKRGQLVASFPAPPVPLGERLEEGAIQMPRAHLAAADQEVLFAAGNMLHRCGASAQAPIAEFEEQIIGLEPAPAWGAPHMAVLLESRMAVCWLGVHQGRVHVIDTEIAGSVAGFTNDRLLVTLTKAEGFLFDADSRGRLRSARFPWRGAAPLAVLRGPVARSFIVIDVNGVVRIFRFSPADLK